MRGWGKTLVVGALIAVTLMEPLAAQSNDDDYTPLNSRIRRDRQFPTDILNRWRNETSAVSRSRSRMMLTQFAQCVYHRNKSGALELLQKTDVAFSNFAQIGLENDRAMRIYGFKDCLGHVANANQSGVNMRWTPTGLRSWLVQEAYFERYPDEPSWIKPQLTIPPREFPLSGQIPGVRGAMDFADCVVATDPYSADFFYRTAPGSPDEKRAVEALTPTFGPCVPRGQQVQLQLPLVRIWLGDALWHAATQGIAGAAPATATPDPLIR